MTIVSAVGDNVGREQVVSVGFDLAEAFDEELILLHVIPEQEAEEHLRSMRELPEFQDAASFSQQESSAAEFARKIGRAALGDRYDADRISVTGRIGRPVDEILAVADESDARHLVIAGRRRSPTGKALFGDVTQSVLLNADCPVTTIMADASE